MTFTPRSPSCGARAPRSPARCGTRAGGCWPRFACRMAASSRSTSPGTHPRCSLNFAPGGDLMSDDGRFPVLRQVVLDVTDALALPEFYRQLLGLRYRPGDEPPAEGQPDPAGQDWLVLTDPSGAAHVAFQQVAERPRATWPEPGVPQQLHLDLTVPTVSDLDAQHERALALGGQLIYDRSHDPQEPLRVYADPAGHPFCIFVEPPPADP